MSDLKSMPRASADNSRDVGDAYENLSRSVTPNVETVRLKGGGLVQIEGAPNHYAIHVLPEEARGPTQMHTLGKLCAIDLRNLADALLEVARAG